MKLRVELAVPVEKHQIDEEQVCVCVCVWVCLVLAQHFVSMRRDLVMAISYCVFFISSLIDVAKRHIHTLT